MSYAASSTTTAYGGPEAWLISPGRTTSRQDPRLNHFVTGPGYLCAEGHTEPLTIKVWQNRLCATALAAAYAYIRLVHTYCVGFDQARAVKAGNGGWPNASNGITNDDVTVFF